MSGKGEGKKRNRAAQSEQHGFQERPLEKAEKPVREEGNPGENQEKPRVVEKLRNLEKRRRQQEKG